MYPCNIAPVPDFKALQSILNESTIQTQSIVRDAIWVFAFIDSFVQRLSFVGYFPLTFKYFHSKLNKNRKRGWFFPSRFLLLLRCARLLILFQFFVSIFFPGALFLSVPLLCVSVYFFGSAVVDCILSFCYSHSHFKKFPFLHRYILNYIGMEILQM